MRPTERPPKRLQRSHDKVCGRVPGSRPMLQRRPQCLPHASELSSRSSSLHPDDKHAGEDLRGRKAADESSFRNIRTNGVAVGLVFAVLYRVSQRWIKVSMTPLELTQLRELRHLVCRHMSNPTTSRTGSRVTFEHFTHKKRL